VVWGVLSALIYHSVAGVKHLVMDAGFGETLEGGQLAAKIVFAVSGVLIILGGFWIW
jgi:succinate dehydrogenase / fumarate reductase cytochrome b subunit